jgi:hypothetical protein
MYIVKTLKEFTYIDEYDKDQGANVRQKAKDITNLLMDESRLREERRSRAHMRDRMVGGRGEDGEDDDEAEARRNARERSEREKNRRRPAPQDDDELKRAIEESKRSLQEEQAKQGRMTAECVILVTLIRENLLTDAHTENEILLLRLGFPKTRKLPVARPWTIRIKRHSSMRALNCWYFVFLCFCCSDILTLQERTVDQSIPAS